MLKFAVFVRVRRAGVACFRVEWRSCFAPLHFSKLCPCKQLSWLHTGPAEIHSLQTDTDRSAATPANRTGGDGSPGPQGGLRLHADCRTRRGPQGGLRAAACATTSALAHLPTTCPWRPTWLLALLLLGCLGRRGRLGREPSFLVDLRLLEQRLEVFLDLAGVVEDANGGTRSHALFDARV